MYFLLLNYSASWTQGIRVKNLIIDEFSSSSSSANNVGYFAVEVDAGSSSTASFTSPVRVHKFDLSRHSSSSSLSTSYASVSLSEIDKLSPSANVISTISNQNQNRMMFFASSWTTTLFAGTAAQQQIIHSTYQGLIPINMYETVSVVVDDDQHSTNSNEVMLSFFDSKGGVELELKTEGLLSQLSSSSASSNGIEYVCVFSVADPSVASSASSFLYYETTPITKTFPQNGSVTCTIPPIESYVFLSASTFSVDAASCLPTTVEVGILLSPPITSHQQQTPTFTTKNGNVIHRFPSPTIDQVYTEEFSPESYSSASFSSLVVVRGSGFRNFTSSSSPSNLESSKS